MAEQQHNLFQEAEKKEELTNVNLYSLHNSNSHKVQLITNFNEIFNFRVIFP